jgi:hypothetical protein
MKGDMRRNVTWKRCGIFTEKKKERQQKKLVQSLKKVDEQNRVA